MATQNDNKLIPFVNARVEPVAAPKPAGPTRKRRATDAAGVSLFRRDQEPVGLTPSMDNLTARNIFTGSLPPFAIEPAKIWQSLNRLSLNAGFLLENGLFPQVSSEPAATAFDILRSQLLHTIAQTGWSRIAVTSPTHGCGKSFVATNLALSLSRRPDSRTVLVDLDLRRPQLAQMLGVPDAGSIDDFLSGDQPLEAHFQRVGSTLAVGLNGVAMIDPSTRLHHADTTSALTALQDQLAPEITLFDLPPALAADDVLALASRIDAILLVVDGTQTSPEDLRACERMFDERVPILGIVLNRAQDRNLKRYRYGKD